MVNRVIHLDVKTLRLTMKKSCIFSSESVSEGHPDKVADQISDSIVDAFLASDPHAKVAIETAVTTDRIILMGETRSHTPIGHDCMDHLARKVVQKIGYDQKGFDWKTLTVDIYTHEQSADIARGVDVSNHKPMGEGAGDQGIMFGYACKETDALMPAPLYYSHKILEALSHDRHKGNLPGLGPDAKTQLSLVYEEGVPVGVSSLVLSTQHHKSLSQKDVRSLIIPYLEQTLPQGWLPSSSHIHINPTGQFIQGGPCADTGLTGRKITVDTYGGFVPHGGGAFSGKDPSKVDRSGAYAMRYLAKNIVAANLASRCTLQIAYAIGKADPLALYIDCHGTNKVPEHELLDVLPKVMDLTPRGVRNHLSLDVPIYQKTAAYGHFGRQPDNNGHFPWEKTDLVDSLNKHLG